MQNILLLGHGISNNALHQFMIKYNINHDYLRLDEIDNYEYNLVIKGPGIFYQEEVLQKFIALGKTIITDIEFIYWFLSRDYIAVTASAGKTSTVLLIESIINTTYSAISCGNIGYPIAQAALDYKKYQYFVLELSSFELKGTINFAPKIAIILNLGKHHLDYHETLEDYYHSKFMITANQTDEDYLIYNKDDLDVVKLVGDSKAKKISFSLNDKKADAYIKHHTFYYHDEAIISFKKCSNSMQYNILASIIVGKLLGIHNYRIKQAIMKFKPPIYRLEDMGNKIINDAKSTSVLATISALKTFNKEKIFLICGGYDRGEPLDELDNYLKNISFVFAYGEAKEKLKTYFASRNIKVETYDNLLSATQTALKLRKKELILYSPMHASYDQYQSYQERGKAFREYIKSYYGRR